MHYFIKKQPHWAAALVAILAVAFYWFAWASDRYVSRATVVLESPQIAAPEFNFASLIRGGAGHSDLLLLREHLLSTDMLKKVESELPFREHYSKNGDLFASLWDQNAPLEELHKYYKKRVSVELDEYASVLNIEVQAFTPEFAHELAQLLLSAGEAHMNDMGQRLAEEQVKFLEQQTNRLGERLDEAHAKLLAYQNEYGLISPIHTVESLNQVVSSLEGELARLQARYSAAQSYQSTRSAELVQIRAEINALQQQIGKEQNRLAKETGSALNQISAGYQALELKAQFAQQTYSSALAALESTRIEAARKLKQVSVLQSPLQPEYATQPERLYNTSMFAIIILFFTFIVSMLIVIIRDHRD
ncbi:chain-length determining protein [Oceanimonas sp. MB9]|uniref:chain-length determining protein n=1 Tax=Oceanimonas sp. MB9 TaxID=2588453 RepID=UPI0013F633B4|nr:chain-length determining protein [Oceanimonas sp. MB9]NHI01621.1 Chromosome partition protein Smc [Oceanimonas sp. MB9]